METKVLGTRASRFAGELELLCVDGVNPGAELLRKNLERYVMAHREYLRGVSSLYGSLMQAHRFAEFRDGDMVTGRDIPTVNGHGPVQNSSLDCHARELSVRREFVIDLCDMVGLDVGMMAEYIREKVAQ